MLPWHDIHQQITRYVEKQIEFRGELQKQLKQHITVMNDELSANWQHWKEHLLRSDRKHLMPQFNEAPHSSYDVPALQTPPLVMSSDGSQVIPNRHEAVPLGLINISRIRLDYLHYEDEQTVDAHTTVLSIAEKEEWATAEQHLSFDDFITDRRTIAEIGQLSQFAKENQDVVASGEQPALLLLDGSLIQWQLAGRTDSSYKMKMTKLYVQCLQTIRECGVPVSAYISGSASREVVQLLQWVEEESGTRSKNIEPTLVDKSINDVMVFERILSPGQRSTVFHSQSKILDDYKKIDPDNTVSYFFLHVGSEVAKVEVPLWLAKDSALVDQTAAVCLQQVELGQGYPLTISLAHETAVVRSADKLSFMAMVEQELIQHGIYPTVSSKLASKIQPVF